MQERERLGKMEREGREERKERGRKRVGGYSPFTSSAGRLTTVETTCKLQSY